MNHQILLRCKYDHSFEQPVTRICLASGCNQERRICDLCLKREIHKFHLKDCVPLHYIELITKRELKRLKDFRNSLQQHFPKINALFQTYQNEIENVLLKLHNSDFSEFYQVIESAIRYYNSLIYDELKNMIFQQQSENNLKKTNQILRILDQHYGYDDEKFMITSFISRGNSQFNFR